VRYKNGVTRKDNSKELIKKALEESLARLDTDYIDLYICHYHDGNTPFFKIVEFLLKLIADGVVRAKGFCNLYIGALSELFPYRGEI